MPDGHQLQGSYLMPAHAHGVRYLRGRLPFAARGGGWKPPFHGLRSGWAGSLGMEGRFPNCPGTGRMCKVLEKVGYVISEIDHQQSLRSGCRSIEHCEQLHLRSPL